MRIEYIEPELREIHTRTRNRYLISGSLAQKVGNESMVGDEEESWW